MVTKKAPNEAPQVTLEDAYKIAQKYHQLGNLTLAERTYRDILAVLPNDFNSLHYLSILCYQQQNYEEALSFAEQSTKENDGEARAWNAYGAILGALNKHEESIDKFNKALKLDPKFADAYSNLSHAYWQIDDYEAAAKAGQDAVDNNPDNANFYINLGAALGSLKKEKEAIEAWEKALEINPLHPNAFINLANAYRDIGETSVAEKNCAKGIELMPNSPEAHLNMGNIKRDQGKFTESEESYRQAIAFRPDYIDAHNNLSLVLMDQFKLSDAAASARFAIAFDPNNVTAHNNLASVLRDMGQLKEAEEMARKSLRFDPESIEAKIELSDVLFLSDRLEEAETLLNDAVAEIDDDPRIYMKLSMVLEQSIRIEEALEAVNKALELLPESPELYHRRAYIYFMNNQIKEALTELNKALELKAEFPLALGTKSEILQTSGDMEGALTVVKEAIALNPKLPTLYYSFSKLHKFKEDDAELKLMVELADELEQHGTNQHTGLLFGLFKAFQDTKNYDKAFEYLKRGNDLKRKTVSFNQDAQINLYNRTKEYYSPEFLEKFEKKDKGNLSEAPIFIVGMPRSGTTLTEQIISSHPKVFGAGELYFMTMLEKEFGAINEENCKEIGEKYEKMVRDIAPEAKTAEKFTDKMPGNYMRVGQILASMPNAKIIHCRRNPIDTCLSCYKQLFSRGHYWSYNQEEMVENYKLYEDMMSHWREMIPDKFIEIYYEDTVDDLEKQARYLIDYVGLEWDDACLTPHKTKRSILTASKGQVRQPIYKTSVEAWRRYEDQFQTVAQGLEQFVRKK